MEGGVEATQVAGEEQVGPGGAADFDLGDIVKRVTLFRVHQIQFQVPVRHIHTLQIQIHSSTHTSSTNTIKKHTEVFSIIEIKILKQKINSFNTFNILNGTYLF